MTKRARRSDGRRPLSGLRLLLVEDDPLLLMDLETILSDAGAEIIGLCSSVEEALPLADADGLAAAVLDFRLGRETVAPVARRLVERGTPFIFYTGQAEADPGLAEWRNYRVVEKPASPRAIVAAVAGVVEG